jgi:hypothetical protein
MIKADASRPEGSVAQSFSTEFFDVLARVPTGN